MGGRGSRSGMSAKGNPYGSQYHTLLKSGNIKFVEKNERHSESLLDTMTKGRAYVLVGGDDTLQVVYFDKENQRRKTIDLSHFHNGRQPHVHHGYLHNEHDGPKGATNLTPKEKRMVERIGKLWYDYLSKR